MAPMQPPTTPSATPTAPPQQKTREAKRKRGTSQWPDRPTRVKRRDRKRPGIYLIWESTLTAQDIVEALMAADHGLSRQEAEEASRSGPMEVERIPKVEHYSEDGEDERGPRIERSYDFVPVVPDVSF